MSANATETTVSSAFIERFELWAREEEGIQEAMLRKHPLPDMATYLDRIVDALRRGFKGYHEMVLRSHSGAAA